MIKFKIATPERVVYESDVKQISIPTTSGEITILPHHIPLVSVVQAGEIKIINDRDEDHVLAVASGFLEVRANNEVIVLADNAERAEDIDIERAEKARARAQEEMEKAHHTQDIDFPKLKAILDRESNRVRVGKKYKRVR